MIASIAASFFPISFRTFSDGKPLGRAIAGDFCPAGMWPNPTTTKVITRCAMEALVASGLPIVITLSNPLIVPV
jgi:hypothetical protein